MAPPRSLVLACFVLACGGQDDPVFRAVEVDVVGLAEDVDALTVAWLGDIGDCEQIDTTTVRSFTPVSSARWEGGAERALSLPPTDDGAGLLVAFAERSGSVIQVACVRLDYANLERPEVTLRLEA